MLLDSSDFISHLQNLLLPPHPPAPSVDYIMGSALAGSSHQVNPPSRGGGIVFVQWPTPPPRKWNRGATCHRLLSFKCRFSIYSAHNSHQAHRQGCFGRRLLYLPTSADERRRGGASSHSIFCYPPEKVSVSVALRQQPAIQFHPPTLAHPFRHAVIITESG